MALSLLPNKRFQRAVEAVRSHQALGQPLKRQTLGRTEPRRTVLTLLEYKLLNACADDSELFYFLFATANYGGQVFPASQQQPVLRRAEEGPWAVSIEADEIGRAVIGLEGRGLLECWALDPRRRIAPVPADFDVYRGYRCLTFEDHMAHFGYGPHEFRATARGVEEVQLALYSEYDRELGWPEG